MKGFCGNNLEVGDSVIIVQPNYKNFVNGKIVKLTEKMAFIEYEYQNSTHSVKKYFHQIIKKKYTEYYLNQKLT